MAKLKNTVTNFAFELPSDEEIINTMKNGLSRESAINYVGNSKILSQNKTIKEHHILDDLTSLIDEDNHNTKIYYDKNTVGYHDNINFYKIVGRQILDLHLFGYRNVKAVRFEHDCVQVQLFAHYMQGWEKSYLTFYKLSTYDPARADDFNNSIFVNDDKFADADKAKIINGEHSNHNVIISQQNKYEYLHHVYVGASFYSTRFFKEIIDANQRQTTEVEEQNLVQLEKNRFENNKFVFSGKTVLDALPISAQNNYTQSLKRVVDSQDLSTYHEYYGSYESINEYLDSLIINKYKDYDSFAEYELAFALSYFKDNVDLLQENTLTVADTALNIDENTLLQAPVVEQPTVKEQPSETSVSEQPTETPTSEAPVVEQPTVEEQPSEASTSERPTETPVVEQSIANEQSSEVSTSEKPTSDNNDELNNFMQQTLEDDANESEVLHETSEKHEEQPSEETTSNPVSEVSEEKSAESSEDPLNNMLKDMINNPHSEEPQSSEPKVDSSSSDAPKSVSPKTKQPHLMNGVDMNDFI